MQSPIRRQPSLRWWACWKSSLRRLKASKSFELSLQPRRLDSLKAEHCRPKTKGHPVRPGSFDRLLPALPLPLPLVQILLHPLTPGPKRTYEELIMCCQAWHVQQGFPAVMMTPIFGETNQSQDSPICDTTALKQLVRSIVGFKLLACMYVGVNLPHRCIVASSVGLPRHRNDASRTHHE